MLGTKTSSPSILYSAQGTVAVKVDAQTEPLSKENAIKEESLKDSHNQEQNYITLSNLYSERGDLFYIHQHDKDYLLEARKMYKEAIDYWCKAENHARANKTLLMPDQKKEDLYVKTLFTLSYMRQFGQGGNVDLISAKWNYLTIIHNYQNYKIQACNQLGMLERDNDFGDDNIQDIKSWFKLAAKAGYLPAIYNLAILYANGLKGAITQNLPKAKKWLTLALQLTNDQKEQPTTPENTLFFLQETLSQDQIKEIQEMLSKINDTISNTNIGEELDEESSDDSGNEETDTVPLNETLSNAPTSLEDPSAKAKPFRAKPF